ncbi:phosphatase PAP2 family protein [Halosquirtibacter xylanolyticus]|uniref:phosphatase PAP2 family protein n=1 Tax=Halosquirtibacter xylanolyticus TaxID=3374599 RepID=UPI003747A131|nr:phosphatase PAP2 family protein [Prolixibacteraceae bacterium]
MKQSIIYLILLTLTLSSLTQAQETKDSWITPLDTCYAQHPKGKSYKHWIPTVAVVGAGFALDHLIKVSPNDKAQGNRGVSYLGEAKILAPLSVGLALTGWAIKDEKLSVTSQKSIEAIVGAAAVTSLLKYTVGRARPYTGERYDSYYPLKNKGDDYRSLPSGHATMAFAFFTPFAENYSRWIYLVPIAVSAQRVIEKQHWPSDVIVGAAIGWGIGYFLAHKKSHRIGMTANGLCIYF